MYLSRLAFLDCLADGRADGQPSRRREGRKEVGEATNESPAFRQADIFACYISAHVLRKKDRRLQLGPEDH